jgi:hypothetical protein
MDWTARSRAGIDDASRSHAKRQSDLAYDWSGLVVECRTKKIPSLFAVLVTPINNFFLRSPLQYASQLKEAVS